MHYKTQHICQIVVQSLILPQGEKDVAVGLLFKELVFNKHH